VACGPIRVYARTQSGRRPTSCARPAAEGLRHGEGSESKRLRGSAAPALGADAARRGSLAAGARLAGDIARVVSAATALHD
jgi:hypothetical protein